MARLTRAALVAVLTGILVTTAGCIGPITAKKAKESSKSESPPAKVMKFKLSAEKYGTASVKVPGLPMAKAPSSTPGVTFEVYTLTRAGGAVQVVFALNHAGVSDYNGAYATQDLNTAEAITYHDAGNIALVDPKGLKEYKTFREHGEEGDCLCSVTWNASTEDGGVKAGDRTYYLAEVAAPPGSVKRVTVKAGVTDIADVRIGG